MDLKGKRLYRSRTDKKLAGVCGGIAEYLGIDPTFIRLLWACISLFAGIGIAAYIIAALIIPEAPFDWNSSDTGEKTTDKKENPFEK